jgi:hypothetical protein
MSFGLFALLMFGSLVLLLVFGWVGMALWYKLPGPLSVRWSGALIWGLIGVAALGLTWSGRETLGSAIALVALLLFLVWWQTIRPSDTRLWADDVALHVESQVEGDLVTLANVRNFDWRTEVDYDVRWETRRYDLSRIQSVDVAVSYWMGPAIGHTLVCFGFSDAPPLAFSVEIRKKRGQSFSAIGGFFRDFERTLIAADERDILRVRTNVRGEEVILYRIAAMEPAAMRSLFLAYLEHAESLRREPRWYNTITANCTTLVFDMARLVVKGLPLDYRLLLSGYLPDYLFDVGALTPGYDFETLRRAGHIVERAKAADTDPEFSRRIRAGVPGMDA